MEQHFSLSIYLSLSLHPSLIIGLLWVSKNSYPTVSLMFSEASFLFPLNIDVRIIAAYSVTIRTFIPNIGTLS